MIFSKLTPLKAGHQQEIKIRCSYIVFSCFMSFGCSYLLSDRIVQIFAIPLEDVYYRAQGAVLAPKRTQCLLDFELPSSCWLIANMPPHPVLYQDSVPKFHLIFTELTEAFITNIYVSALVSFYFSAIPIIFAQAWWFIKPGLYNHEKRKIATVIVCSLCLSIFNLFLTYFFLLPAACGFFSSFSTSTPLLEGSGKTMEIHLETRIYAYFGFVVSWVSRSHLLFQCPIIIWLCVHSSAWALPLFTSRRKVCHLILALISGLISPPDLLSQFIFLIPLLFLYEAIVFLLLFSIPLWKTG